MINGRFRHSVTNSSSSSSSRNGVVVADIHVVYNIYVYYGDDGPASARVSGAVLSLSVFRRGHYNRPSWADGGTV